MLLAPPPVLARFAPAMPHRPRRRLALVLAAVLVAVGLAGWAVSRMAPLGDVLPAEPRTGISAPPTPTPRIGS
jgi:hypothetical protein